MADRIIRIRAQHRWLMALFEMPDTITGQQTSDIFNKGDQTFEIAEHRNRRDQTRAFNCGATTSRQIRTVVETALS